MTQSDFREKYFEALGLERTGEGSKEKIFAALSRAHDIRKFEIELYWKRATYFWAFQAVAFAAVGFLFKDGDLPNLLLLLIPSALGVITAFSGWLTARGSKFWQENWEAHVDMLESEIEGRLTQVIISKSTRPEFSVSRVNQRLILILAFIWGFTMLVVLLWQFGMMAMICPRLSVNLAISVAVFTVVSAICVEMYCATRTNFDGRSFGPGNQNWSEFPLKKVPKKAWIIWRDPPGGRDSNDQ